jgi:hypothetical protein
MTDAVAGAAGAMMVRWHSWQLGLAVGRAEHLGRPTAHDHHAALHFFLSVVAMHAQDASVSSI